jgi:outer membrane protein, heavy metal efflux system
MITVYWGWRRRTTLKNTKIFLDEFKMKKLLLFALNTSWVLLACEAGAQTLTLEQAIRTVWENAPQIAAQKSLAGIYSDDTWRRWFPQEPTISWEDDYSHTFYTWGLSLTYPFPFKSLVLSQLDSAMAEQQRWEFTAQKYDLAVSITQAYMNGATAQAMIEFQKQNVQDLETIAEAIRLQYVHGQSNQINKISAELQLTAAQRDLKTAENQLDTAVELYARLMHIPPSQVTGFELPDDLPSSIIKELGNKTSAQLRDKANVDVGEANRATGFWSQFPDPTFSLSKDYYLQPALNDSPTGNVNDYNFSISFTLPILFPVREVAEAQRSENQGVVAREMSRFSLVNDNSAQEAGAMDYRRSKIRYKQLHSRDLILAETMMQAAVAAYKKGQFEFTALMLAHQTYAAAKTEEIQIRAEIVNARLAGLVGDEEPEMGGKTDYSSNLPNTDTYLWDTPKGIEKNMPSTLTGKTPTPVPTPHHLLGTNNPVGNSDSSVTRETVMPTPEVESPNPPEVVEPGATPVVDKDRLDSDKTTQTTPPSMPAAGVDDGDSSKETK